MNDSTRQLDAVLDRLDEIISASRAGRGDAIDRILNGPRRRTETHSLRDHPAMEAFRRELTDGLIRADTANKLLGLISAVLTELL